jgi:hypothetical protein
MHEVISFLKSAVDRTEMAGMRGCYVVKAGQIYSRNFGLQAGVEFPSEVDFNIPASRLDAALARMKQIDDITLGDDTVTIKSGRLRSTIKLLMDEAPLPPDLPAEDDWVPCPAGLVPAMKVAKGFVGKEGWQSCVRLLDGRVTAFKSAAGIDVTVPGLVVESILVTTEVVDFLVSQGSPDFMGPSSNNTLTFRWGDGRWLRVNSYASAMPEAIIKGIFEQVGNEIPVAVDDDFRAGYADAAGMTDDAVALTPRGLRGRSSDGTADSVVDIDIPGLPDGHESFWATANQAMGPVMDAVVPLMTAWNPTTWPAACYWEGENMRGVVVGRRGWL